MPRTSANSSRSLPRWLWVSVLVLLVARVAGVLYERAHPSRPNSLVAWVSLEEARRLSRERGRPILYHFTAEWCEPCHLLERQVFSDAAAARLINAAYVPVRLVDRTKEEGENPPEVEELQREFQVVNFPSLTFALADEKGVKDRMLRGFNGYSETLEFLRLPSPRGFIPRRPPPAGTPKAP